MELTKALSMRGSIHHNTFSGIYLGRFPDGTRVTILPDCVVLYETAQAGE